MKPTTLNEYYTSQGQSLPSVSARQGAAAQAGIQNYTGTAAQNTQLLGYLQSSGSQGTPTPVIPAPVAIGTTQPTNLPNRPEPQAPTNAANSAMAYLSSIPKTGVAGIDSANQAISQVMQNTIANPELLQKQTKANELKAKADLFNEEYRKKAEAARTNPMLGAETLNSRLGALERERAFTAGTLAIEAAAAQQDFTSMKQLLNEQAQIELEPLKFNRDFFSTMYQKTEDQRFQRAMKAEDRAYQSALEDKKMLNDIKMQAFKDGKIGINDLGSIKTWEDLKKVTGVETSAAKATPLLPDGKPDVVGELTNTLKFAGKDVPSASLAVGVLEGVKKFATANPEGKFVGATNLIGFKQNLRAGEKGKEFVNTKADIGAIKGAVQKWMTGANVGEDQRIFVDNMTPKETDSDFTIRTKLNNLTNYMQGQAKAELAAKGIQYNPTSIDYFAPSAKQQLDAMVGTTTSGNISPQTNQQLENNWNSANQGN